MNRYMHRQGDGTSLIQTSSAHSPRAEGKGMKKEGSQRQLETRDHV